MVLPRGPVASSSLAESALFDLVDVYDRAYELAAATQSLSAAQACVLGRVAEHQRMTSLADQLGCDASNITQIVGRLEAHGLVARVPSPDDGRARLVVRTSAGDRVYARFEHEFGFARAAVGRLTGAEQHELTRLVRKALGSDVARSEP